MRAFGLILIGCLLITTLTQAQNYFAKAAGLAELSDGKETVTFRSEMVNMSCLKETELIQIQVKLDTYLDQNSGQSLADQLKAQGNTLFRLNIPATGFRSKDGKKNVSTVQAEIALLGKIFKAPVKVELVSDPLSTLVKFEVKIELEKASSNPFYQGKTLLIKMDDVRMEAYINTKN